MKIYYVYFFIFIIKNIYAQNTIIINEILIDPVPQINLPNAEYIELKNISNKEINIFNYGISNLAKIAKLPSYVLKPDSMIVITSKTNKKKFSFIENVIGINSFPSLNNQNDTLILLDNSDNIIHVLSYSEMWFKSNKVKSIGGWSLEMIDCKYPFATEHNWSFSTSVNGGTPGLENAVKKNKKDTISPNILYYEVENMKNLKIFFNKILDSSLAKNIIKQSTIYPDLEIKDVKFIPPIFNIVSVEFSRNISEKTIYELDIPIIKDLSNNSSYDLKIKFGLTEQIKKNDIIINEILFNSTNNENDFIEIYNRSNKILNLKTLLISSKPDEIISLYGSETNNLNYLFPKSFKVITTNKKILKEKFPFANEQDVIESKTANFSNNKSKITLYNLSEEIIDELQYFDTWHYTFVTNQQDVSLEKINYNLESQNKNSWHSASFPYWGSPTIINSQFKDDIDIQQDNIFSFSSNIITPDKDGIDDFLLINYSCKEHGNLLSVKVFDLKGNVINDIQKSVLIGTQGVVKWDGLDYNSQEVASGNYIIILELVNPNSGKTEVLKKIITLSL